MGRLVAIALIVAAAGITLVAVNGPGKDKPKTDKFTPTNQSSHVGSGSATGANIATGAVPGKPDRIVHMKHLAFIPSEITVKPGAIIRFVNRDDVAHTVVENLGARSGEIPAFESQRILPGHSFQIRAGKAGSVTPFICTLHPTVMSGRIFVRTA
jgi:plastocyanin